MKLWSGNSICFPFFRGDVQCILTDFFLQKLFYFRSCLIAAVLSVDPRIFIKMDFVIITSPYIRCCHSKQQDQAKIYADDYFFLFFLFLPFFCAMIPLYSFAPFLYTHRALSAFCEYILFLDNYIPFVEEYNFNSLNIFLHFVNSLYFPFTGAYAHPSADTESECPSYQIPV